MTAQLALPIPSAKPGTWAACTDPTVRALTARIDTLRTAYDPLPNGPERNRLHAECTPLLLERRARFDRIAS